jgi:phospholipid/cholesterol/gamma-HCH transport system permease protein
MGAETGTLQFDRPSGDTLSVRLAGSWKIGGSLPKPEVVLEQCEPGVQRIALDGADISEWDTGLLTFLVQLVQRGEEREIETDRSGLPEGVRRLIDLAFAVPEKKGTGKGQEKASFLARVGTATIAGADGAREMLTFLGEATQSFGRLILGRARFRRSDLSVAIQECGPEALGIVTLISFLIGLILAFMGAVQLQLFGAEIYVADLVAIGMAREMAPMMTGIIMAGRTGAAYAAQLGTMTVNEEIDSLRTLGFSPMDFLVLPRMLALMLMMPLLTLYSNILGILGGYVVGTGMLGIASTQYWSQTVKAVDLGDFAVGLVKASVIGVLVAVAGCMRGMQCGRSASAVGLAATSAVVTGIVAIIVSEAVFAVVFETLGI